MKIDSSFSILQQIPEIQLLPMIVAMILFYYNYNNMPTADRRGSRPGGNFVLAQICGGIFSKSFTETISEISKRE
jgi:hypothetical protein